MPQFKNESDKKGAGQFHSRQVTWEAIRGGKAIGAWGQRKTGANSPWGIASLKKRSAGTSTKKGATEDTRSNSYLTSASFLGALKKRRGPRSGERKTGKQRREAMVKPGRDQSSYN